VELGGGPLGHAVHPPNTQTPTHLPLFYQISIRIRGKAGKEYISTYVLALTDTLAHSLYLSEYQFEPEPPLH